MECFYIKGGNKLSGELEMYPAKNACLPILAASIINRENVVVEKCSQFSDVLYMIKILESLGVVADFIDGDLHLNLTNTNSFEVPEEFTKKVRSSIFMLGSLLSRFKYAKVSYPGGCNIGSRPIDIHLRGLEDLGVLVTEQDGYIICDGTNMKSGKVVFAFPSVGATENIMMASVLLSGTTKIINAAKEPEIEDLQNFLNAMGANIKGAGTSVITIEGVDELHYAKYRPIPDRIITGTYLIAGAITGGQITLNSVRPNHLKSLLKELKKAGCKIKVGKDSIVLNADRKLKSVKNIQTRPYPGFPTDLQSPFLTLQTVSEGVSVITENLYETRFKIYTELVKMGANISIRDRSATIIGVDYLYGATVTAPDLRSGAGLVLAGLCATGDTIIKNIENIERGYLHLDKDLKKLGADIERVVIED